MSNARIRRQAAAVLAVALAIGLTGCGGLNPPLEVVDEVDLESYAGKWYEIARYPNWFEQNCVGVTAEYAIRDDGRIDVVNTCRKGELDGPIDVARGVARIPDPEEPAKLKVNFSGIGLFEGDYWILELDPDYEYAVVGEPGRRFLWILSRSPTLDESIYQELLDRLPEKEYDPDRLVRVPQPPAES